MFAVRIKNGTTPCVELGVVLQASHHSLDCIEAGTSLCENFLARR